MGPLPVTAAWEQKPRKASMARRPFFTSFSAVSEFRKFRGSKGAMVRKPVCSEGGGGGPGRGKEVREGSEGRKGGLEEQRQEHNEGYGLGV